MDQNPKLLLKQAIASEVSKQVSSDVNMQAPDASKKKEEDDPNEKLIKALQNNRKGPDDPKSQKPSGEGRGKAPNSKGKGKGKNPRKGKGKIPSQKNGGSPGKGLGKGKNPNKGKNSKGSKGKGKSPKGGKAKTEVLGMAKVQN